MSDLTRRGFVKSSAGAAVGMTAIGALDVGEADAKGHATHKHPVVAWIGDPRDGKITVMSGKREVTIRDHKLAARIARAAK
jgi:hypothetical protein